MRCGRRDPDELRVAFFEPKGLLGLLYWYVLYPIHSLIFSGLTRQKLRCKFRQQCEEE
jgi:Protein of unknown function (DUF2867)